MEDKIKGIYGEDIAKVIFNEPEQNLRISRWASEFSVEIPVTLNFRKLPDKVDHGHPYLNTIWGNVYAVDTAHNNHKVGEISNLDFKEPFRSGLDHETSIKWRGHVSGLALFEKIRDGQMPRISLSLWGDLQYHVHISQKTDVELIGRSRTYWLNSTFDISKEIWIDRLRRIGLVENVLVEIPLTDSPPSPWDDVWNALTDARDAFEKGGSTGWKACVVSCRLAMEKWQSIEKEDQGPGWKSPSVQDRQLRTKAQRMDNLRWHLMQIAHESAHSHADNWDRDDAVLLLSTLSALLAQRRP